MRSFLTGAPILKPKERSKRCAFSYSMCKCRHCYNLFSTTQLFIKLKLLVHVPVCQSFAVFCYTHNSIGDIGEVTVDGKDIDVVTKFVSLGALIAMDGLCEKEVRRRIAMGKAAMGGLTSIWKDRDVTLETKVKLVKVLVFPIVLQ